MSRYSSKQVIIANSPYTLYGSLAKGEACDLFFGNKGTAPLTELVVIKTVRKPEDQDMLVHEWTTLQSLHGSKAKGSDYFVSRLPQLVARGPLFGLGTPERASVVYRWRSGFIHTLDDVLQQYPRGVEPQTAIWIWKRLLELVGFVHNSGYVHCGILPRHVILNSRDHGASLVGWSRSCHSGEHIRVFSAGCSPYYPTGVIDNYVSASVEVDIVMISRCIFAILGGDFNTGEMGVEVPAALSSLIRQTTSDNPGGWTAWGLLVELDRLALDIYGTPRYHPFHMPGWS
jgi:hypothetical protein